VAESEGLKSFYFDLGHVKCKSRLSSSFELLITVWFFHEVPTSNLVLFVSDDGSVTVVKKFVLRTRFLHHFSNTTV
jgi:hypothetical protein